MLSLANILVLLASMSIASAATCNANNCARLVTGTRDKKPSLETRRADCSQFMLHTVTPAVVTESITITTTVTSTKTALPLIPKRQVTVTPSAVPAYATGACPSAAAYSSACSCWGITASYTTVATPTVTVTATQTTTAVVGCTGPSDPCEFNRPDLCCSLTCCADLINGGSAKCGISFWNCSNVQPRRGRLAKRETGDILVSYKKLNGDIEVINQ